VSRFRPLRRRLRKMARPLLVELRLRNPCCRTRRLFEGWYCRFMSVNRSDLRAMRPHAPRPWKFPGHGSGESSNEAGGVKRRSGADPMRYASRGCWREQRLARRTPGTGGTLLLSRPSGTRSSISEMEEREGERKRFNSAVTGHATQTAELHPNHSENWIRTGPCRLTTGETADCQSALQLRRPSKPPRRHLRETILVGEEERPRPQQAPQSPAGSLKAGKAVPNSLFPFFVLRFTFRMSRTN
jgi:hypothetical protein